MGEIAGIIGGAVVVWAIAFWMALRFASRIDSDRARIAVKSAIWSIFFSLGFVAGHGFMPAPALVMLFLPGHLLFGLLAMMFWFVLYMRIGMVVAERRSN